MNKTELVNAIAEKAEISKADAKKAVDAFVSTVTDALKEGDKIALVGFGTFSVNERPAREGINPATKEKIRDLGLPEDAIIGGVVRGDRVFIAVDDTQINAYDRVVVFAMPDSVMRVAEFFN